MIVILKNKIKIPKVGCDFFIEFTRFNFTATDSLISTSKKRETLNFKFYFKSKIGIGFVKFCLLNNPDLDLITQ